MSCLAASSCNLTIVLSNFGLWFLFYLGIMTSIETRRKPTTESTLLSQSQRNSSYESLFLLVFHMPSGHHWELLETVHCGSKTTRTTPHQQSRISGCLKFITWDLLEDTFWTVTVCRTCLFFKMLFENVIGQHMHWNPWCLVDSAFSKHIHQALTPLVLWQLHEDLLVLIDISFLRYKGSFGSTQWS